MRSSKKCNRVRLCNSCVSGKYKYCMAINCNNFCDDFTSKPTCKRITRFPYVCNACVDKKDCSLSKYFYKANEAYKKYKHNISTSKQGPKLDSVQLRKLDLIVSDGVKKGHSLDIIVHKHDLHISSCTLYHYISDEILSVKNIDLKRQTSYKHRYTNKPQAKPLNYNYLRGRSFSEFKTFYLDNSSSNIWQMDTVEGTDTYTSSYKEKSSVIF